MSELTLFQEQQADLARRAASVMTLVGNGDREFFEGVNGLANVRKVWQQSLEKYHRSHGQYPSNSLMASAHAGLERLINGAMLEAGERTLATSSGLNSLQAVWGMVILPALLESTTSRLGSFINAASELCPVLRLDPVAASTTSDYTTGDSLTGTQAGRFACMNRLLTLPDADQPDGTKTSFAFDTATLLKASLPIRPGSIQIVIDKQPVPVDLLDGRGAQVRTSYNVYDAETPAIDGATVTVDYVKGVVTVDFAKVAAGAPKKGVNLALEADLDEEVKPDLIPSVNQHAIKFYVHASRYACSSETTIQAAYDLQRESNIDMKNTLLNTIIAWITTEMDVRRLRKAAFYNRNQISIDSRRAAGEEIPTWLNRINKMLVEESDTLQESNGAAGFVGCYAGEKVAQMFRSFPMPEFMPDPTYEHGTGIRRAGRLFGKYDVFAVPDKVCVEFGKENITLGSDDALFFGNNDDGHSPLLLGEGIPLTAIDHGTTPLLRNRYTAYGSEVCAANRDGWKYMTRIHFEF